MRTAAPLSPESSRSALHTLLDESLALPPEYDSGLSSHLPMALEALTALGAKADRLRAFAAHYAERLAPSSPSPATADASPELGRFDHFAAWQRHFTQELSAAGRDATLRAALPVLMPGVSAAAFHGLIRVGHAVRAEHDGELASALAYWASRHQVAPTVLGQAPLDAATWLGQLRELSRRQPGPTGRLIFTRMAAWTDDPDFRRVAARLPFEALPTVAAVAAEHYAATRNFTLLHVVTATAALQRLAPWLAPDLWGHAPAAVAAAWLASDGLSDAFVPIAEHDSAAWPTLAAAAIAHDDDHAIKLTLACRELDELHPAPVWRQAAARALALQ